MTELIVVIGVIVIYLIKKIWKANEPGLPAFKDHESSLRHSRDANKYGKEYAEQKWRNGDYS